MTEKLYPGDIAPSFNVTDHTGKSIVFEHDRGRKVLLAFYRFSACALCNLRVHRLIERYPEWQRQGLDVIVFFESPDRNLHAYVGRQNAPFSLVADPKAAVYDLYGVEVSDEKVQLTLSDSSTKAFIAEAEAAGYRLTPEEGSNFNRIPAEFLIDEEGVIRASHYSRILTDHLPIETIDRFAAGE